jgi:hypothetical protein
MSLLYTANAFRDLDPTRNSMKCHLQKHCSLKAVWQLKSVPKNQAKRLIIFRSMKTNPERGKRKTIHPTKLPSESQNFQSGFKYHWLIEMEESVLP